MKSTKVSFVILSIISIIFVLLFSTCKKDDETENIKDLYIVDIKQDSEFDYWVICKTGDYLMIKEQNSKPSEIYAYAEGSNAGYSIFLSSNGLPSRVVIGEYIFLFDNFNGTKVDVSVVKPNGEISIERNIESGFDWSTLKSLKSSNEWSDVIRWTGHVGGAVGCTIGLMSTVPSAGITLPLTIIGCGATIVGIIAEFIPEGGEILGLSATTVGTFTTVIGCVNIANPADQVGCALGLVEIAADGTSTALEEIEGRQEDVRMAESVLYTGHGKVQITLTWNNHSDTDLHVVDPNGEEIWWKNKYSYSGGILDYDDRDGFGPENIYWGSEAPNGIYEIYVHHFEGAYPTSYTVAVIANDKIKKYTGTLSYDELVHVTDLSMSGFKFSNNNFVPIKLKDRKISK